MLGQVRLGLLQKLRARQHVEEIHGFDLVKGPANTFSVLLRSEIGSTITQGWSRGQWDDCVVTTSYPSLTSLLSLLFQILRSPAYSAAAVRQADPLINEYRSAWYADRTHGGELVRLGDGGQVLA